MQEVHADKVLMLAIGNNDYISYNKLFDRYYGRLCQYVYSLLMDRNDAEDVVQENQDLLLLSYEDNQLETEEFRIALYDCIDHLPGRSREVLLLHRVKGLKQKEISEKLSISVKTIKNQIWMSLQKLKECLEMKEV